jgi:carboxymethylenebutenolidase
MQQRKQARDFDPRILEIYDGYVHGKMTMRRNTPSAG